MLRKIAIAIVAAGALALAWRMLGEKQAKESRTARIEASLPSFDDRAVTGMTLETADGSFRLERDGNGWAFTAPIHDTADASAVGDLLVAARKSPIVQTIPAADDPASFCLAPPTATITFDGGGVPRFEIGKTTPTGEGVFVRIAGRPGILVAGLPQSEVFRHLSIEAFRDPSWMGVAQSEITAFEIARGSGTLRVDKRADGWWIVSPRTLPAATEQVGRLLGILSGARVVAVDDGGNPADPKYGLSAAVRFVLHAGSTARMLALGADAGGGRYFATSDSRKTILVVSGKGLEAIPTDAESLRDPRLTTVNRYAVVKAAYEGAGRRFAAARVDDATWKTDAGKTVPAADVYGLLVGVLSARTSGVAGSPPKGLPAATLTYTLDDGKSGRVEVFAGREATWDALPGVTLTLSSAPPAVPDQK